MKGLGSTWKVKKSDHSLSAPFAFVRGKKKFHACASDCRLSLAEDCPEDVT